MRITIQHTFCLLGALLMGTAAAHASPMDGQGQSQQYMSSSIAANNVIYFEFDSAVLDQSARAKLDQAVAWLRANPQRELMLEGHASQPGSAAYNQKLSLRRAVNAKEYIVSRGIPASRVHVQALGEEFRISASDAGNRRVFFYASRMEEPVRQPATQKPASESAVTVAGAQESPRVEVVVVQEQPAQTITMQHTPAAEKPAEKPAERERLILPWGASLTLGGGVTGFLDSNTRALIDEGVMWEARLSLGTHSPLPVEVAYAGSLNPLDARGLDEGARLIGHGVEGIVRLNPLTEAKAQPYLFAGMGWTRYKVENTAENTSPIADSARVLYLPAGLGVGLHWKNMVLDLRGTVRTALQGELIEPTAVPDGETERSPLHNWAVNARLGWEL